MRVAPSEQVVDELFLRDLDPVEVLLRSLVVPKSKYPDLGIVGVVSHIHGCVLVARGPKNHGKSTAALLPPNGVSSGDFTGCVDQALIGERLGQPRRNEDPMRGVTRLKPSDTQP